MPIVNVDSFSYISQNIGAHNWNKIKYLRKNRRIDPRCNFYNGGVDLNRNYGYKFAYDDKGSSNNPCSGDYRGSAPFSEPETQAVKTIADYYKSLLVSAMHFHSWGDLWVMPFNYKKSLSYKDLQEEIPKLAPSYHHFIKKSPKTKKTKKSM